MELIAIDDEMNTLPFAAVFAVTIDCTAPTTGLIENTDVDVGIIPTVLENVFATVAILAEPFHAVI